MYCAGEAAPVATSRGGRKQPEALSERIRSSSRTPFENQLRPQRRGSFLLALPRKKTSSWSWLS